MGCPYRKEHEFDDEGLCKLCYAKQPPPIMAKHPEPEAPWAGTAVIELPSGWPKQPIQTGPMMTWCTPPASEHPLANSALGQKLSEQQLVNAKPHMLQNLRLSQLYAAQAQAIQNALPFHGALTIAGLERQLQPYTKAAVEEQDKRDEEYRALWARREACSHEYVVEGDDGYDCNSCGTFLTSENLAELRREQRALAKAAEDVRGALAHVHVWEPVSVNQDAVRCVGCRRIMTGIEILQERARGG